MRYSQCVAATIMVLFGAAAHAGITEYIAARKACPPRKDVVLATARANPAKFRNTVLELRGVISGISRSETSSNVLLRISDADTILLQCSAEAVVPTSGESARALVTVQESGALSLLAMVTETEIGDRELDPPAKKPATGGKSSVMPNKWPVPVHNRSTLASRNVIDPRILPLYQQVVSRFNPRLTKAQAELISRSIVESSYQKGVDARLIMAIFATESGFKINARSRVGAMGLGQLMPRTARSLGVSNAWDPQQNIQGAVKLIQQHWVKYAGKSQDFRQVFQLVCAAYNAGPNAVKKYGGIPPYRETQNYVKKVAAWYKVFAPELFQN